MRSEIQYSLDTRTLLTFAVDTFETETIMGDFPLSGQRSESTIALPCSRKLLVAGIVLEIAFRSAPFHVPKFDKIVQ